MRKTIRRGGGLEVFEVFPQFWELMNSLQKQAKAFLIPLYQFLPIKHEQVMAQSGQRKIGLESAWSGEFLLLN